MPKKVELTCPACQTFKTIDIPDAIFDQKKFGTIKIQVPPGAVCPEHQFIAFVDTKGIVRGYERIDLLMGIEEEDDFEEIHKEVKKEREFSIKKLIKMYGLHGVFSLIHAKLFYYPAYIIKKADDIDISNKLNAFLDDILPENFKELTIPIKFIDDMNYDKIKLKEKNALLIDSQQYILQTPWDEKLKFEESLLTKALEIIDIKEQLVMIRQDIALFMNEAEHAKSLLEDVREIYKEDLILQLSVDLKSAKINKYRLNLIKDYISQRYSKKLSQKIKNKVQEFLNLL